MSYSETLIPDGKGRWQQGQLLELEIEDLSDSGDGVGRIDGLVVFVPDTVPGDRILVRLVRVKSTYAQGKLQEILVSSPHRVRPHCIVADKCGGCQWQQIDYSYQLEAKQRLLQETLMRIGGFGELPILPMLGAAEALGYRNKSTYPVKRNHEGNVQAGYFQKGSHHLINLNQCPVQDDRLDPLLAEVKQDIQQRGWAIYDETKHRGKIRHLSLRIGRNTGEILLTLITTSPQLTGLEEQAQQWLEKYPQLVGVCLNLNPQRGNTIFGEETRIIAGKDYLTEEFAGLSFQIRPETFFQVYTEQAEKVVELIRQQLNFQGTEVLIDAYCGVGTLSLPLAKFVGQVIGLEVQPTAVSQAILNSENNQISNATFQVGAVEDLLPKLDTQPDIVLIDPPRQGCDRAVLETLIATRPAQIVYVSCKPATLARDLKTLCQSNIYQLQAIQPIDFFPQTSHLESVAFLSLIP